MPVVTVRELLEAGVHFGHRTSRWNPKMKPYILGKRNFIHIIDLKQTVRGLVTAIKALGALAQRGGIVLFVGTKRAAQSVILNEAQRCGMPYVAERWIGGTLTNFATVRSRLKRLVEIETMEADGRMNLYGRKEQSVYSREKRKLLRNLDGIRTMEKLPDAIFIVDPRREKNALAEAKKVGLLTVSLLDTDADPTQIDIPIPGNDDAMRVIQIITSKIADAILAGRSQMVVVPPQPVTPVTQVAATEAAPAPDEEKRKPRRKRRSAEKPRREKGSTEGGRLSRERKDVLPNGSTSPEQRRSQDPNAQTTSRRESADSAPAPGSVPPQSDSK